MLNQLYIIDDISNISSRDLDNIKKAGLFYVKMQDNYDCLQDLRTKGLEFFRSDTSKKMTYSPISGDSDWMKKNKSFGYNNRRSSFEHLETFRQLVDEGTVVSCFDQNKVHSLKCGLVDRLGLDLVKKVLQSFSRGGENSGQIDEMINNVRIIFSFVYYPTRNFFENLNSGSRLNPHKDTDLITIIVIDKPGLQYWADGKWVDIYPKRGYALAMFGYDLELITKGRVRSSLHRVRTLNNEERMSTVFFVSMKKLIPFQSTDGEILCDESALPDYKNRYQKHNILDRVEVRKAFDYTVKKINIGSCIIFNAFLASFFKVEPKTSLHLNIANFAILNAFIYLFKATYFERMSMDYLQYPECPAYADHSQVEAYNLGKSTFSFFGLVNTFSNKAAIVNKSFWNAGAIRSFIGK